MSIDKLSGKKRKLLQRKRCRFCQDADLVINYKETKILSHFITERGKIIPRRISGTCARHQRQVMMQIKRARHVALLPFVDVSV